MVDNPTHHPGGDFHLQADGQLAVGGANMLTFSGIGIYRPQLLDDWRAITGAVKQTPPRFPLAPLLRAAMVRGQVSGEYHSGLWTDVGTPERLAQLINTLKSSA